MYDMCSTWYKMHLSLSKHLLFPPKTYLADTVLAWLI